MTRRNAWPRFLVPFVLALVVVLAPGRSTAAGSACDDTCKITGARAYVDALVSHDASKVPFHPRATRVENGVQTGFSGAQLRHGLENDPQYKVIQQVQDAAYVVRADGVVVADYTLAVGVGPVPMGHARVHETFAYDAARPQLIRTIVAEFSLADLGGQPVPGA
jgi:hypothetical protein